MMTMPPDPSVRIVICGNADRGDDGVALATVASLLPTLPRTLLGRLEVRRCVELRVEDLVDVPAGVSCLILDAVAGIEPGTVVRLTLGELERRPPFTPRSSHQLPIDLVVGLAGILRDQPVGGTFIGLAGHGFGYGRSLSRVARAAMPAYHEAIEAELYDLALEERAGAPARSMGA
jgi:hydrogenase maturation protease